MTSNQVTHMRRGMEVRGYLFAQCVLWLYANNYGIGS